MKEVERNVLCVLLKALLDKELITRDVHDKSREKILDTLDDTGFFCYVKDDRKEDDYGHA